MPTFTLTILDTVAIQNYIFGSNRLKENVGASELVKQATETWAYESLPQQPLSDARIEDGNTKTEVVYVGGGNTVILFADEPEAKAFAARLSEQLITAAPGIELAVVHQPFDWAQDALGGKKSGKMFEAFGRLADLKRRQLTNRPLIGLGVTATCQSTGQPAVTIVAEGKETPRLISAEVAAKLKGEEKVNKKLIGNLSDSGYEMISNFDELGSKDESSYLAVVHADGNGMGKLLEQIGAEHPQASQNRAYLLALRSFSHDVKAASEKALKLMEEKLLQSVRPDEKGEEKIMGVVPVKDKRLPYRRLVSGGDDLTFVCDGRLALTLIAFYLKMFEQEMKATHNPRLKDVHACAGIAVVKSHYPFARAYELAESLSQEAKKWVKESDQDFSALDWHFAPSGVMGELNLIRDREYRLVGNKTLLLRPVALDEDQQSWRNWPNFKRVVLTFKRDWAGRHNKVKRLQQALRAGEEGVKQFLAAYQETLPDISSTDPNLPRTGWAGEHCGYYDAIEAIDFFVPLHGEEGSEV